MPKSVRKTKTLRGAIRDVPGGDVVVYFTAAWCSPCQLFGPVLEDVAGRARVPVVKVDIDKADPKILSRQPFSVRGVPTLLAYRDRNIRKRLVGAVTEPKLVGWFAAAFPKREDK